MLEQFPHREIKNHPLTEHQKEFKKYQKILVAELIAEKATFLFPGITEMAKNEMNAIHLKIPKRFPSADEILEKFTGSSIKLIIGKDKSTPLAVPIDNTNTSTLDYDIPLRYLIADKTTDQRLALLIKLNSSLTTIENLIKDEIRTLKLKLLKELSTELLPFPGIRTESYRQLKKDEEEFPGFVTPIDELLHKLRNNWMFIYTKNPPKNIVIAPIGTTDIVSNSIFPHDLLLTENTPNALRELIRMERLLKNKK